ncbi:MAG: glycosyltransferase family 4 protein [Candidatus Aenigmatarchaeota archaeon]
MDILFFTLRDVKHPKAGGAELAHNEIMKRLNKKGHNIVQFTSSFNGAKEREVSEGKKVFRKGNKFTVYLKAKKFYKESKFNFDLIIDEWHTTGPFHAPEFTTEPTVLLVHMIPRELWDLLLPKPVGYIMKNFVEKIWLYKNKEIPTITFSDSTVSKLKKFGFKNVEKVPLGTNLERNASIKNDEEKVILFLGKISKRKGAADALEAFKIIENKLKSRLRMEVAGDGPMLPRLKSKFSERNINFHGYVSEKKKEKLLEKSDLILVPSKRENWCLVVTEANSKATPALGYDIPGLRDSINHGRTGILTNPNPLDLSKKALKLLRNKKLLKRISENALRDSKKYQWDKSAEIFERKIKEILP